MEKANKLNKEQTKEILKELGQTHILEVFDKRTEEEQNNLIEQINYLESVYPGGLREYKKRATVLLNDSKNKVNPFANYTPSVPEGVNLKIGSKEFYDYEAHGLDLLKDTGFVLVAGGLGERLGYDDIKIGIPAELLTQRTFLKIYIDYMLAYESRIKAKFSKELTENWSIPLCIMTSDDTYKGTVKLLEENNNYGLKKDQITLIKQEKVPALINNDCHMHLVDGKFEIETKPSGHGAVHTLLHSSKTIQNWEKLGKKFLVFFQDTNALIFNTIPSALGVSSKENLAVNSITVPRRPGEAVGAICKLTDNKNKSITINVEYNQLDNLLKAKYNKDGDVPNKEGYSDFPGNINVLVFNLESYSKILEKTKGLMPEFVNPKYTDDTYTSFKSATRLESMMQDYPRLLEDEKVGFTNYERWFSFSACKNNLKEGAEKVKKGLPAETAFSVEQDIYDCNIKVLTEILNKLEISEVKPHKEKVEIDENLSIEFGPKIVILPSFAVGLKELDSKIENIKISNNSALIIQGESTRIGKLTLDGFLAASSVDMSEKSEFKNEMRFTFVNNSANEEAVKNFEVIRGYHLKVANGSTSQCECKGR